MQSRPWRRGLERASYAMYPCRSVESTLGHQHFRLVPSTLQDPFSERRLAPNLLSILSTFITYTYVFITNLIDPVCGRHARGDTIKCKLENQLQLDAAFSCGELSQSTTATSGDLAARRSRPVDAGGGKRGFSSKAETSGKTAFYTYTHSGRQPGCMPLSERIT